MDIENKRDVSRNAGHEGEISKKYFCHVVAFSAISAGDLRDHFLQSLGFENDANYSEAGTKRRKNERATR